MINMIKVKICGITRPDDAEAAVALGADALGFVFWPGSPRCIDATQARAIVRGLPAMVTAVGVFADQSPEEVGRVAAVVGLGAIQLHGGEAVAQYAELGYRVIKAVPVGPGRPADDALALPGDVTALLDAHDPVRRGGTGKTIDWSAAARVARARRVILSGGLRPENVADAVAMVAPYGIDVSSGVETAPGRKDLDRLRALFGAIKRVR